MSSANALVVDPTGRRPRGAVLLNGKVLPGWLSVEVDNNVFNEADTFHVTLVASALPKEMGPDWFVSQPSLPVEIRMGFPPNPDEFAPQDLDRWLVGRVDTVEYDPVAGTVTISGRDDTGVLIDTPSTQKYANQTASQIATAIAVAHGFTPKVTPTKTSVGTYYKHDKAHVQDCKSEWDLLCWLAQQEGFITYMHGDELHFEPRSNTASDPYVIAWLPPTADRAMPQANVMSLKLSRDKTIAGGVSVTVSSAHNADGKSYTKTWSTQDAGGTVPAGTQTQKYALHVVNKKPEECLALAQAIYAQRARHEMKLEATLPADAILKTSVLVRLTGTGTEFDQDYWPDSVRRTMSKDGGYLMTLSAKNMSPDVEKGE